MNSDQYFKDKEAELKGKKKQNRKWLILILLLFLLLLFLQYKLKPTGVEPPTVEDNSALENDVQALKDSLAMIDSLQKIIQQKKDSILAAEATLAKQSSSVQVVSSSSKKAPPSKTDSIPPEFEVNPISGKYEVEVKVNAKCLEEKCELSYDLGEGFKPYLEELTLTQTTVLKMKATDSVGNSLEQVIEYTIVSKDARCGKNGVFIESKGGYCIDKYEWPNEYGASPMGSVSQAKAAELCESVGKKLCSVDQWQNACSSSPKGNLRYSYGNRYQRYCNTNGKTSQRSGYKENCRSWNGVYDMGGNHWEWTSTPDKKMKTRFLAAGGNFASKDATSCNETTFSFFPQNEYVGLGFRCCHQPK